VEGKGKERRVRRESWERRGREVGEGSKGKENGWEGRGGEERGRDNTSVPIIVQRHALRCRQRLHESLSEN